MRAALGVFCLMVLVGCSGVLGLDHYGSSAGGAAGSAASGSAGADAGGSGAGTGGAGGAATLSQAYAATVLTDGAIAHWRLAEATSTFVAFDETGRHPATYGDTVQRDEPGIFVDDAAAVFTTAQFSAVGVDEMMNFYEGTAPFSLEAWVRVTDYTGDARSIIDFSHGGGAVIKGMRLYVPTSGRLLFARYDDLGERDIAQADTAVPTAEWLHVVATYDGTTMKAYIDARLVASSSSTRSIVEDGRLPMIGARGSLTTMTSAHFHGSLDEVAVYGVALSESDILAHCEIPGIVACGN